MADWTVITDAQLDPDAPLTSDLAYAWRDNPIAIAEGASGAPRIVDAALGTTPTTTGASWIRQRLALAAAGTIGTYAFLRTTVAGGYTVGNTLSGASLAYTSANGNTGGSPSGTWLCCGSAISGETAPSSNPSASTLWLRVS